MGDFDEARFVEEVLQPVQDGWRPSDNLFRAYMLPLTVGDPQVIRAALDRVQRQLGSPRASGTYPSAVARLRAGHAEATEVLTDTQQRQAHAAQVRRMSEELQGTLRDRLSGGPGLPNRLIAKMVTDSRGTHTRDEIRVALAELSASAQEPVDLPSPPQRKEWPGIKNALRQMGKPSLWDYLSTTPTLAAAATTDSHLEAETRALRLRRDPTTGSERTLVTQLRSVVKTGGLIDVLRFELLGELQSAAGYRFPILLEKVEQAGPRLKALGISEPARAVAYAVWCRERFPDAANGSRTAWKVEKRDAKAVKDLRRAIEVLKSAEGKTADENRELADLTDQVHALDAEIARAQGLERQQPEEAAAVYLAVRAQLDDPAVEAGLARCRPRPARGITARLDGSRAAIAWQPSPSTAGRLGYTVVRAVGHPPIGTADGQSIVTDTADLSVVDPDPPAAQELFYAVFALREGTSVSEPVASTALVVLPEVVNLELVPSADTIRARWQSPQGAAGIDVGRRLVGQEGTWTPVRDVRHQDFTDTGVTPGVSYEYRVQVRYSLPGGRSSTSGGRTVTGRCQEVPVAVTRLDASLEGDDVVLSWPVPARGDVEIRLLVGDRLPASGVVPVASLDPATRPLGDIVLRRRSDLRARPRAGTGSLRLVAVTVLGDLAAIGPARVLDRRIRPITELRAARQGGQVELTWVWPEDVIEARVLHAVGAEPSGPEDPATRWHMISRVAYDAVGARFPLEPGENVFAVSTTSVNITGRAFGPLVCVTVSSIAEVGYRITKARRFGPRRRLSVGVAAGPPLPPMQLVARSRIRPMERSQGRVILDLPGDVPERVEEFDVPDGLTRPIHLRLFSLDPAVVLRADQPDELVIR